MSSQGDWILPGLRSHPLGNRALVSSINLAYSSLSNCRRLEHPLYAFWGKALNYLVEDLEPSVLIAPQYTVYIASKANPNVSLGTVADNDAEEKLPDFVIMGVMLSNRSTREILRLPEFPTFSNWQIAQLAISKPLCAFEAKRAPGRHFASMLAFQHSLHQLMDAAIVGAEAQARIIFRESSYNAQSLILIAAAGEWWSFRFVTEADVKKEEEEDDDDDEVPSNPVNNPVIPPVPPQGSTEDKTKGLSRFTTVVPTFMECFKEDVADARLQGWSKFILFGTRESNQRLYLIHEELKSMAADLEIEALTQLQQWIDDGYESDKSVPDAVEEDELSAW
ncbi:hypothetical protein CPB84DRAFT_1799874 [Gymnopilus junonius]|uniref:Uncharacterized protein n=1 Tax=Gymnopilus junonius TaxID=109634 RepID=A0A9P5N8K5_GYMJU|nr:hypothetical protein CPB84DRAFT_1799874 [Gymnopilus junonius]